MIREQAFPAVTALLLSCGAAIAAPSAAAPKGGEDLYPEGALTPRFETPAEAARKVEPPAFNKSALENSPAALGARVYTPAEYDEMEAIFIAWEGWYPELTDLVVEITTNQAGDVWVVCDLPGEINAQNGPRNVLTNAGADMDRVHFFVARTDTVWIRDYGPRIVYMGVNEDGTGGVRAIVDHTYNILSRTNDDYSPVLLAEQLDWPIFTIPLRHGGGNYHLSSAKEGALPPPSFATRLIVNENGNLTEDEIIAAWRDFQNVETVITQALPRFVDGTQHIDMWMQVTGPRTVVISEWIFEPDSNWGQTCEQQAAAMEADGWTVYRTPAMRFGGTHYTFTNMVMMNGVTLIPQYDHPTVAQYNDDALAILQQAMPDRQVIPVPAEDIVWAAGVFHCVVMHVPAAPGGEIPTVWVQAPQEAATLHAGDDLAVTWYSDDNTGVEGVAVEFSADGGATFQTLASGLGRNGSVVVAAPDVNTATGILRVVASDANGNSGHDDADGVFRVVGTCPADLTNSGAVDVEDLLSFLGAFRAGGPMADFDLDGEVVVNDLLGFLGAFRAGC